MRIILVKISVSLAARGAAFVGLAPLACRGRRRSGRRARQRRRYQAVRSRFCRLRSRRRGSPTYTPQDRKKVLLQYVIENELMAGAGQTDNLDKADTFPGRVKYHERRALRDAFFDVKIHDAVHRSRRQEDL